MAGSYDNEAVAIFALIFTFYLYIKVQSCSAFNFVVLHAIFPVSILLSLRFWCSTFILWNDGDCLVQTLNTGSLFYATLNALAYFYMVGIYFLMVIAYLTSFCSLYIFAFEFIVVPCSFRFAHGEDIPLLSTLFQCTPYFAS